MKVLLSAAVWGRKYANLLANYSIASQLSPNNIPLLAARHEVTYHIVTTAADGEWLRSQPNVVLLARHCRIVWDYMEAHGIAPNVAPIGLDDRKYPFLSRLQNIAIAHSLEHDAIVFNYADFVWADGSLTGAVSALGADSDAVLSFCLPVDQAAGIKELNVCRRGDIEAVLDLSPRTVARIAIECLHREARLRLWDGPKFTNAPTYLLWQVGAEGLVIRAYHQTVLVLRVKAADPAFRRGIPRGTLDGYFTSLLAETGRVSHAADSDAVMVFSLYTTNLNSQVPAQAREESLRRCLRINVSEPQRRFAEVAIRVKQDFAQPQMWEKVEKDSWAALEPFHATVPFDQAAHDSMNVDTSDLDQTIRHRTLGDWIYRYVLLRFAGSGLVSVLKIILGGSRARALRVGIERLIYGNKKP